MPPRFSRTAIDQSRSIALRVSRQNQHICLICSFSQRQPIAASRVRIQPNTRARKHLSTASGSSTDNSLPVKTVTSRQELREALSDLQKHAASYVNISRLQLALRGLDQPAGDETIRIAILGQADGGASLQKAKQLLTLLVADPLKTEEAWERILSHDRAGNKPILLKVGHDAADESLRGSRLVQEIHVSSPMLNGHKLELLVLEMDPPRAGEEGAFTEAVLVPTMEIPTSSTGRYTPVTTPVHKALIIGEGIPGAASALGYPKHIDRNLVGIAVDALNVGGPEKAALPFQVIDIALGSKALAKFRQSVDNALIYEQDWFASGVPEVLEWIKIGTAPADGKIKEPMRKLVESVILNATTLVELEQARQLAMALTSKVSSKDLNLLRSELTRWAEKAHTELRDQLDIAFEGRRWSKLGWWKLFWRVDDVSMIASDILTQRFLPEAEKNIIFLAGSIAQAGVLKAAAAKTSTKNWAYKEIRETTPEARLGSAPRAPKIADLVDPPKDTTPTQLTLRPWPIHIPVTRMYLAQDTVPALQALAQKLVLQTLSTSSLASAFSALIYLSSVSTGLYEAGAVAALGIVWSLRRMQGKWEAARKYWEGEVREEGRKAVRGVEGAVTKVLTTPAQPMEVEAEFEKAREAVSRATAAFKAIR